MGSWSRRGFLGGAVASAATGAYAQDKEGRFKEIDSQVDSAIIYLLTTKPETEELRARASGLLMIPVVTKAGLAFGGSYGEGALRVDGATVDYFSALQLNWGLQLGAKQYSYALFFMNDEALDRFRNSSGGWRFGADLEAVVIDESDQTGVNTLERLYDVVGIVFGQAGFHVGMSLEGTVYNRLKP